MCSSDLGSGSVHALTGLCIGLGPPGTLRLILARLFCNGSVHALTGLRIGLGPLGTLRLILARLFGSGSVQALIGLFFSISHSFCFACKIIYDLSGLSEGHGTTNGFVLFSVYELGIKKKYLNHILLI